MLSMLLLVASLSVQATPDFSGTWVFDEPKTAALLKTKPAGTGGLPTGNATSLPPSDIVIRQTAGALSIERNPFGTPIILTFKLDGSESGNKSGAVVMKTRTRWEGKRLVTEGTKEQVTSQGFAGWRWRELRSLGPDGSMVVESTHTPTDEAAATSTVQVFSRKREK